MHVIATRTSAADLAEDLSVFMHSMLQRTGGTQWLEVVDAAELSLTQLKALVALRAGAELTVKDLGAALSLSVAATSRAVDGLFQRDLLERREDEHDRRMKRVRLSQTGRTVLTRITEARLAGIEAFVETLTPAERQALADGLAPIIARFQTSPPQGSSS